MPWQRLVVAGSNPVASTQSAPKMSVGRKDVRRIPVKSVRPGETSAPEVTVWRPGRTLDDTIK